MNNTAFLPSPVLRTVTCEECGGEGTITVHGEPGWYDRNYGMWLPSESAEDCERCDGFGEVEIHACPICDDPEDDCMCSEEDFEHYFGSIRLLEAA